MLSGIHFLFKVKIFKIDLFEFRECRPIRYTWIVDIRRSIGLKIFFVHLFLRFVQSV